MLSKKYQNILKNYQRFAPEGVWDFSEEAAEECYSWESKGIPKTTSPSNGFALGKKYMDVTVSAWIEDLTSQFPWTLTLKDLREDYEECFLQRVLGPAYKKALARCPL